MVRMKKLINSKIITLVENSIEIVFDSPHSCQRKGRFDQIQGQPFVKPSDAPLVPVNAANQSLVVPQRRNLPLVEQQLLPLHPLPEHVKGVSHQLSDCTQPSNHEVDVPLRVTIRPPPLHAFLELREDEERTPVVNKNATKSCPEALVEAREALSLQNSPKSPSVVVVAERISFHGEPHPHELKGSRQGQGSHSCDCPATVQYYLLFDRAIFPVEASPQEVKDREVLARERGTMAAWGKTLAMFMMLPLHRFLIPCLETMVVASEKNCL